MILTEEGAKAIEEILAGDLVLSWDEETGEVKARPVLKTYVNETEELVHIRTAVEEIVSTPGHRFYSPVRGWTSAIDLRAGDILVLVNGEYVVVEQVQHEILEAPVKVYNFNVAECHTYYVTASGVLVHNSCDPKHTPDQRALIELAKENKNGLPMDEANILVDWAKEYGINNHKPMIHPNGNGHWSNVLHIKVFKYHIPISMN